MRNWVTGLLATIAIAGCGGSPATTNAPPKPAEPDAYAILSRVAKRSIRIVESQPADGGDRLRVSYKRIHALAGQLRAKNSPYLPAAEALESALARAQQDASDDTEAFWAVQNRLDEVYTASQP